jgi:FKBP-type peptidyl-prolyl cis-trans isomerase FklB
VSTTASREFASRVSPETALADPPDAGRRRFAERSEQCDNRSMKKPLTIAVSLLAAGILPLGIVRAQQTPTANPQEAPAAKPQSSPQTGSAQTPATKPPSGTTAAKSQTPPTVKKAIPLTLKTDRDKASYAIGMNWGASLHKQSVEVDPAILMRGIKDGLAAGKTLMTEDEMRAALTQLQNGLRAKQQEIARVAKETSKKEGDAFLAANKDKEGVVALPSGLQYKILTEGTGPKPAATDSVVCNYSGKLINGTEFDSSYKRGQPVTFPVTGVIKGWTEALQLMPVGSKWELFIPAELAYGEPGRGPAVPPNSTLIFEVELISIQSKDLNKDLAKPQAPPPAPTPTPTLLR